MWFSFFEGFVVHVLLLASGDLVLSLFIYFKNTIHESMEIVARKNHII